MISEKIALLIYFGVLIIFTLLVCIICHIVDSRWFKALDEECKRLDDNQWNLIRSVEFEYRKYFEELGIVFLENRLDCKTCKDIGYCPECPYPDPD